MFIKLQWKRFGYECYCQVLKSILFSFISGLYTVGGPGNSSTDSIHNWVILQKVGNWGSKIFNIGKSIEIVMYFQDKGMDR